MDMELKAPVVLASSTDFRKRVRFSDTDLLATYYEEAVALSSGDGLLQSPSTANKNWKVRERRSQASLGSDHHGKFALIQPGYELLFEQKDSAGSEKDSSSDIIRLSNTSSQPIAFKVKTTGPEKFRVRPSVGFVEPGGSKSVEVSLLPSMEIGCQKERFLVLTMPVGNDAVKNSESVDVWQSPSAEVDEHKLRCTVVSPPSEFNLKASASLTETELLQKLDLINSKLDSLIDSQLNCVVSGEKYQKDLARVFFFMLLFIFIFRFIMYLSSTDSLP